MSISDPRDDGRFFPDAAQPSAAAAPAAPRAAPPYPLAGRVRSLGETLDDSFSVLAFLRAGLACGALDPDRTLWVVDLAPSDGERAWRVLQALQEQAPRGPAIRYLACCRDPAHRDALSTHPPLRPLLDQGRLRLDLDGEWLRLSAPRNPLVVLAHEAFSAAEQRLYRVGGGVLEEAVLEEAVHEPQAGLGWQPLERRDGPARLLAAYACAAQAHAPQADTSRAVVASLPLGAMRTLEALLRLSEGRMLVRALDRGIDDAQAIRDGAFDRWARGGPSAPVRAGRLPVNFDALGRWHRANGSGAVYTQRSERGRVLHLAIHDRDAGRLQACLQELSELPHPDDHIALLDAMAGLRGLAPAQCVSLLHATHADPRAVHALRSAALTPAEGGEHRASPRLRRLLARSERLRYPPPLRVADDGTASSGSVHADTPDDHIATDPGRPRPS